MKEALYYEKLEEKGVKCLLCPNNCTLQDGKIGICMGRQNIDGTLYAINYAETTSLNIDPIEKKPLYHFYPSRWILSIAGNSCNLKCVFCQNWTISQRKCQTKTLPPEELVKIAIREKSIGVSYTYTEPLVWYEYVLDSAKLIRKAGLVNVMVSNGYINEEPLRELLPWIDAWNIDLKGINEDFYKKNCKGKLQPVLDTIKIVANSQSHLEITNLIIPSLNDSDKDIEELVNWIAELDEYIPLHLSAYHPDYNLNIESTPRKTLERAYNIAKKKLKYVFVGNIFIPDTSNTYCPNCNNLLIKRSGFFTQIIGIDDDRCAQCGYNPGIGGVII